VGICEQHAVGLAGGLAGAGLRPVFAVYSAFLQRAYDQLHHDVALQEAPVVFCIDRAGLVGNDGPTHHGLHDISCCRSVVGMNVMAPRNAAELKRMLELALASGAPSAIRYPRESVDDAEAPAPPFELGRAELMRQGRRIALVAYGALVKQAVEAADHLKDAHGIDPTVVNARFVRPMDEQTLCSVVNEHDAVVLAEDHSVAGGFGSAVLEMLVARGVRTDHVRLAAVPQEHVTHATRRRQLALLRLDGPGLAGRALEMLPEGGESNDQP
jgi:1-deoxy-D-xylulose-5-phosphate synthase